MKSHIQSVTDHLSGPGRAIGVICVCLCHQTIIFEWNDLWPRYLACRFISTLCRSRLKAKVTVKVHCHNFTRGTKSSAVSEWLCGMLRQLKSCQLLQNCTKNFIWKRSGRNGN